MIVIRRSRRRDRQIESRRLGLFNLPALVDVAMAPEILRQGLGRDVLYGDIRKRGWGEFELREVSGKNDFAPARQELNTVV